MTKINPQHPKAANIRFVLAILAELAPKNRQSRKMPRHQNRACHQKGAVLTREPPISSGRRTTKALLAKIPPMSVSLIDVSGPIMIGPSSSHTAGALKLGQFARAFFGELPSKVELRLHGSFGAVYRGHATDRALVAGLLNFKTHSPEVKIAFEEAQKVGLAVKITPCSLGITHHPNTVQIVMQKGARKLSVTGSSIGGGAIIIRQINDFEVRLKESVGLTWTVVVMHRDTPGIAAALAGALAGSGSNSLAAVTSVREAKNGSALTIVETEERPDQAALDELKKTYPGIQSIFALNR